MIFLGRREEMAKLAQKYMGNQKNIRNIGIVAHIDHGKTTLTDNLIAAAGLISKDLAGKQLFMDSYDLEQQRGITINASNISIVYKNDEGQEYLINIIDTPGHVDFGGDVIRAMRAVDAVVVVVDAVEGVMPQTETVIRQALREYVKPVLFINKVDRLIKELQLNQEQMQERFVKTIVKVNELIAKNAPEEFAKKWQVKVEDSSVAFGSAYHNWAVSAKQMKDTGISFKDVYKYMAEDKQKELAEKSPLFKAVLDMVVTHHPNPLEAQKYRIPAIWSGDLESDTGKAMQNCDPNGPFSMMITDVVIDPHAGDVATGRIYSGTIKPGMKVKIIGSDKTIGIQQIAMFMGPERVAIDHAIAGNIASLIGLKEVYTGQTIAEKEIEPFESFKSNVEPVMTISVEPKQTKDLPKLIEVIRQITKEDPNIKASLNQDTGEHLISGMGELHLEVTQYRIEKDNKIPIKTSPPIVVYQETITKESPSLEGKSPNKHNKFLMRVEPMPEEIFQKLKDKKIDGKIKPKDKVMIKKFEECGFDNDTAKRIWAVKNNSVFIDETRGIQALHEIRELIIEGFIDAMEKGPLAGEKMSRVMVILEDAKLHEDAIHRGPSQILPLTTRTIYACVLSANPVLLEPKQKLTINVPVDYMGSVTRELSSRRAQIIDMRQEGDSSIIVAIAPVKELIGFSGDIRSATQGRAIWTAEYYGYERLPRELTDQVIKEIRERKGMGLEVKKPEFFLE